VTLSWRLPDSLKSLKFENSIGIISIGYLIGIESGSESWIFRDGRTTGMEWKSKDNELN
jgi:hypothetical protein